MRASIVADRSPECSNISPLAGLAAVETSFSETGRRTNNNNNNNNNNYYYYYIKHPSNMPGKYVAPTKYRQHRHWALHTYLGKYSY
jgi:hypothetical protein